MKMTRPDSTLERLLLALEDELLEASDAEVLAAAHELGMKPEMRASAAFFGVTMLTRPRILGPDSSFGLTDRRQAGGLWRRPKGDAPE